MARILTSGAESASALTENVTLTGPGPITFDTATKRSGARSFKLDTGASSQTSFVQPAVNSSTIGSYFRAYLNFAAFPTSGNCRIFQHGDAVITTPTKGFLIQILSDGSIAAQNANGGATLGTPFSTYFLTTNTWYRFEAFTTYGVGATDSVIVRVTPDGGTTTELCNASGLNLNNDAIGLSWAAGWCSSPNANAVMYVDDIALNDTTGTDQNSFPGDGKVALLLPISDNARATLWTGGGGGLTNLWDAVNNTPPVGIASGNNTSQIEHGGGAAGTTDSYDANMTTYTTAGVGASDTVKLVEYVIVHGEDVATGTKLLNMQLVSNPTDTISANFTAGNDAGQATTYPTLWVARRNGIVYNPSVTKGTSPVARVRRPEIATRVASVCFMGVFVEYQPTGTPATLISTTATATAQAEASTFKAIAAFGATVATTSTAAQASLLSASAFVIATVTNANAAAGNATLTGAVSATLIATVATASVDAAPATITAASVLIGGASATSDSPAATIPVPATFVATTATALANAPLVRNPYATRGGTNRLKNPSFETNAALWNVQVGNTITRDSAESAYGNWSGRIDVVTTLNATCYSTADLTGITLTGVPHLITAKLRVKGPAGTILPQTARIYVTYTSGGAQTLFLTNVVLTGEWQELTAPPITTDETRTISSVNFYAEVNQTSPSAPFSFYVDGADLRIDEPDCDDYIDGSFGGRYTWTGTAHASTSVRTVSVRSGINRITNPSFEVNTAGWAIAGPTVTRDTGLTWVGTASLRCDFTATNQDRLSTSIPTAGLTLTGASNLICTSFRAWLAVGKIIPRALFRVTYTDATSVDTVLDNIAGTGAWQTITLPVVVTNPAKTISTVVLYPAYNVVAQPAAWTVWLDGIDVRFNEPDVDTYIDGDQGVGYAWTGVAHASASTRFTIPAAEKLDSINAGKNWIINPSVEVNQTNVLFNNLTGTRTQENVVFGTWSTKAVTLNTNTTKYVAYYADLTALTPLTGVTHTFRWRARVWLAAGTSLRVVAYVPYTDTSVDVPFTTIVGTGQWQWVDLVHTIDPAKTLVTSPRLLIDYLTQARTVVYYVDAVDLRIDEPDNDTYIDGSLGGRYAWTGTAHNSPSTRSALPGIRSDLLTSATAAAGAAVISIPNTLIATVATAISAAQTSKISIPATLSGVVSDASANAGAAKLTAPATLLALVTTANAVAAPATMTAAISALFTATSATATSAAQSASITCSALLVATTATATAQANASALLAASQFTATVATATTTAQSATISGAVSAKLIATVATATPAAGTAALTGNALVAATLSTSTAQAPASTFVAIARLIATVATANANAGPATLSGNAIVVATIATSTAQAGASAFTAGNTAFISASVATATSAAQAAVLTGSARLSATVATATSAANVAAFAFGINFSALTATATSAAQANILNGAAALSALVTNANASATASSFKAIALFSATVATASTLAQVSAIQGASGAGISAGSGSANASAQAAQIIVSATLSATTTAATAQAGAATLRGQALASATITNASASAGAATLRGQALLSATTSTAAAAASVATLSGQVLLSATSGAANAAAGGATVWADARLVVGTSQALAAALTATLNGAVRFVATSATTTAQAENASIGVAVVFGATTAIATAQAEASTITAATSVIFSATVATATAVAEQARALYAVVFSATMAAATATAGDARLIFGHVVIGTICAECVVVQQLDAQIVCVHELTATATIEVIRPLVTLIETVDAKMELAHALTATVEVTHGCH